MEIERVLAHHLDPQSLPPSSTENRPAPWRVVLLLPLHDDDRATQNPHTATALRSAAATTARPMDANGYRQMPGPGGMTP